MDPWFAVIISGLSAVPPVPVSQEGVHQHHHQEDQGRGLVPALHDGHEHWLHYLQGGCAWAGEEAGIPQQGHLRVLNPWHDHLLVFKQLISYVRGHSDFVWNWLWSYYCCDNIFWKVDE